MKIAIVATEASADFLGLKLINVLQKRNKNLKFFGIGGPLMESTGFDSFISINNFNTIGIAEVFFRIPKFLRIVQCSWGKLIKYKLPIYKTMRI